MNSSFHKRLASFAAILTLISTGAFAAAETKAGPAAYVDDATVTVKVKTALIESPEVKAHQVEVETRRGVVQLNGFVDSAAAKNSASRITMAVKGVNEVHNNLVIADKTTVNEKVDDGMLTAKVKAALIADPATKAYQINVTTKLGMVQLSGFVDSMSQKSKATDVARSVAGVKDVDNVLEIKGP